MFEYLELEIITYGVGFYKIKVKVIEKNVYYKFQKSNSSHYKNYDKYYKYSDSQNWLDGLAKLDIENWMYDYSKIIDKKGTQWTLDYKEANQRCKHIYGDNAYPDNWNSFIEHINTLHKDINFEENF